MKEQLEQYYEQFEAEYPYQYLNRRTVRKFATWLEKHDIKLEDAFQNINRFGDTLPVIAQTKRNYQCRLRRFMEFVYKKEGIEVKGEVFITKEGEYYVS